MESGYELHAYADNQLPIILHIDATKTFANADFHHWHENIEILFFLDGNASVLLSDSQWVTKPGDMIVINSNRLHSVAAFSDHIRYHCLIVDYNFCSSLGLKPETDCFPSAVKGDAAKNLFQSIIREYQSAGPMYKPMVKSLIAQLLISLFRENEKAASSAAPLAENAKIKLTKDAIAYIRHHYTEDLSTSQVGQQIGVSLYHLCRCFREVTKVTVTAYINALRCETASTLLATGNYTVSEVAASSGFSNLSYFTKIYRQYQGICPSEALKRARDYKTNLEMKGGATDAI